MVNEAPKFEHTALEKDIERLAAEVKGRVSEETPEARKEAVKAVVGEKIQVGLPPTPEAAPPFTAPQSSFLPNYLQTETKYAKLNVEKLVDLAWHKGINAAVKEAKKLGPLYIDALHDALTDKLYSEFKNKGLL